jgi:hypothetical protein
LCVNTQFDPANCGSCGIICTPGTCKDGICLSPIYCTSSLDCAVGPNGEPTPGLICCNSGKYPFCAKPENCPNS